MIRIIFHTGFILFAAAASQGYGPSESAPRGWTGLAPPAKARDGPNVGDITASAASAPFKGKGQLTTIRGLNLPMRVQRTAPTRTLALYILPNGGSSSGGSPLDTK